MAHSYVVAKRKKYKRKRKQAARKEKKVQKAKKERTLCSFY